MLESLVNSSLNSSRRRLASVPAGDVPMLRFTLHPSVRIARSPHPIVGIWQANIGDAGVWKIDPGTRGDDALVVRPAADVEVRRLPDGAA